MPNEEQLNKIRELIKRDYGCAFCKNGPAENISVAGYGLCSKCPYDAEDKISGSDLIKEVWDILFP